MRRVSVAVLVLLSACGGSQDLEIYDVLDTTTAYDCWGIPAPDPKQMVIGIDQAFGTFHLYTCDDTCSQVKVEVTSSKDGRNFKGETNTTEDSRGCSSKSTLTATVSYSGDTIHITEHSVQTVSVGCDRPGICTQDHIITGARR